MAAKKKTAAKKPARRATAPAKAATRKPARAGVAKAAKERGGEGEVVYSDVLHELRGSLVSRLIR
jgi:hypothetical protein